MRIVFLGSGEIGVPTLRALVADGHDIAAVVTQPDRPAGRDLRPRPSPIKELAGGLGLEVWQPAKIRGAEALDVVRRINPELMIVAAYGQILPQALLDIPPFGCINVHASLLPRHRGASPIHAAILAGDRESGVTIMQVVAALDAGDMWLQRKTPIEPEDTAGSLHDRLAALAPDAVRAALDLILGGVVRPTPQDESQVTYAPKLTRDDGRIDWSAAAELVARRIRGLSPWPGTFTTLPDGSMLKIHRARVVAPAGQSAAGGTIVRLEPDGWLVAAGEGEILVQDVQAAGGRRQNAADFARGHGIAAGMGLGRAASPAQR